MTDFREDGHAAVEWAARYLERVGELPVLAQVQPGELSAKLPLSPPEHGEPFANVLRDLDELIVPALTNWQHPRFFAYFAVTASEPGILAELLAATLNQVAILWRASPASSGSSVIRRRRCERPQVLLGARSKASQLLITRSYAERVTPSSARRFG